jgi:hypothetical protein
MLAWAASMAAIFGVVTAGVAVTRQTVVSPGSALMMTKDGSRVVQTAVAAETLGQASSALSDAYWQELTHLGFLSSGANGEDTWVRLNVVGTARIQGTGTLGSVVQVMTSLGSVTFDDTAVLYSADIAPLLTDVGIIPAGSSGRRLLASTSTYVTGPPQSTSGSSGSSGSAAPMASSSSGPSGGQTSSSAGSGGASGGCSSANGCSPPPPRAPPPRPPPPKPPLGTSSASAGPSGSGATSGASSGGSSAGPSG